MAAFIGPVMEIRIRFSLGSVARYNVNVMYLPTYISVSYSYNIVEELFYIKVYKYCVETYYVSINK